MTKRTAAFHNLGCKVNAYEMEAAEELLKKAGYEIVPFAPGADIYIINTCTVTNIADRKSRQMLHKARAMNPEAIVIAMGCYAQTDAKRLEEDDMVDIIVGNDRKGQLAEIIAGYTKEAPEKEFVDDLSKRRTYETLEIAKTGGHIRGFMKVQDGCDQFCSYCIIPYARGRVRSRPLADAVAEARLLAAGGCREVVLSGIHLSSYGRDLGTDISLLRLIEEIHAIDGIRRIRLGSLEPGIITEDFVQHLCRLPKICPHFHLSLQSGCDKTLKAMNRRYDTAEFQEKCTLLRQYFDNPSLTTDVITGFPGETPEDFEKSRQFVEKIGFFETHIFPYSRRQGTRAAAMPGQLPEAEKKRRASVLIKSGQAAHLAHMKALAGREEEVLFEEQQETPDGIFWTGHTMRYEKVAVCSAKPLRNQILRVRVEAVTQDGCALAVLP